MAFWHYPSRRLVGDCTAKSQLFHSLVTDSAFADDIALYATSCDDLESVAFSFVSSAKL